MRDFQLPGRSAIHAQHGIAGTSHPLATLAAIETLRRGGNAIDAAVTASAVLAVVEPQSTGIGGDCFALYAKRGRGEVIGLNGSGRAPAKATHGWYAEHGMSRIPGDLSPHCVTVPGAIDAWARLLADHGTIGLGEALAPAIDYAENGYVISPRVGYDWAHSVEKLSGDENARRVFLPQGRAPRVGEIHRQPELADALKTIAREGRDGFYRGWVAADVVGYLQKLGGLHTLDDFAANESTYVTPIKTTYHDHEVLQIPPNGQGITVLLMLNILNGLGLGALDPLGVERFHLEGEATRLAYRMRDSMIADPAMAEVPVDEILSPAFADNLRKHVDRKRAMNDWDVKNIPLGGDTVYLTVVDKDRNACSFINSLYQGFGSALTAPKSGVLLQNRGAGFVLDPKHPNCIAPGKRPFHTIIPGMVRKKDRVSMTYGVMGGHYQPVGHTHVLTNVFDFGMDLQQALDCPRAFHFGGQYALESGVPEKTAAGLAALGHNVVKALWPHGGGQAIRIDWQNETLEGGSEPRKDGCALGY
ncbi:MAG: gamma-glutamyltransferase [Alphaproteobacteria bacterium]|nr:gamma-glutamyltransferase [Alphaproteobacteria bacterium]